MAALDDDAVHAAEELMATLDALGIGEELVTRLMESEGIVSLTLLGHSDEAEVTSMLKRVMKPALAAAAVHVSGKDEHLIQVAAYAIGMLRLCGRTAALEDLTPSSIRSREATKKTHKEFKESTSLPKPTELPKSWVKIFDSLKSLLRNHCGDASKVCLLYLIRDDETLTDADLDPRTNYTMLEAELIARCPHWEKDDYDNLVRPPYFEPDNRKLWVFLFEIFQYHASFTHVHASVRGNGRRTRCLPCSTRPSSRQE
jgi:hypothetical protein